MYPATTLERTASKDWTLVILASFLICLSGQIAIPLWFTPIPLATRNTLILLTAALLGSRKGTAATLLFLLQGALGLPVFSNGAAGIASFFGPQGGYLVGYVAASYLVGSMMEKGKSPILSFAAGNLVIYLFGASYLATFVGFSKALLLGVAPFILGDLLKSALCLKFLEIKRNSNKSQTKA